MAQIKALKTCELFIQKPYVICCVFHFSQAITRKMKELGVFKKKLNHCAYEILRSLEILAFIELDKLNDYLIFLKKFISISDNEKKLMNYFESTWLKKIINYLIIVNYCMIDLK